MARPTEADLFAPEGWTLDVRNHADGPTTFYALPPNPAAEPTRFAFEIWVAAGVLTMDVIDMRDTIRAPGGEPIGWRRHTVTFDQAGQLQAPDEARAVLAAVPDAHGKLVMELATSILAFYL